MPKLSTTLTDLLANFPSFVFETSVKIVIVLLIIHPKQDQYWFSNQIPISFLTFRDISEFQI